MGEIIGIKLYILDEQGHFGLSTVEELEMAIRNCKVLIFESAEHSERRKNLVNKLVQLRMKLQEAKVKLTLFPRILINFVHFFKLLQKHLW